MRNYKFRIYPSKTQEMQMKEHLWIEKNLWNTLLEANQKKYDEEKKFLTRNEMQKMVKDTGLFSQVAQTLSHRLQKALWRMVKLRKQGKECGYPRFKNIDRMKSLNYPQAGFKLDKKLKVTPFGEISIKQHRKIEGNIKTLTLKKEPSGKWFAIFCAETMPQTPKINIGEAVGLDLGLMNLATLSNGEIIKNPHQFKKLENKLAKVQRDLSKKHKKSHNKNKAKLKVATIHEKIANTRLDYLHKQANSLLSRYSLIAMEKLNITNMSRQSHSKNINDASWGIFTNILCYKAEEAGSKIVFVNPKDTTKMCSNCGTKTDKHLWERTHNCPSCGLSIDRDLNASINILIRATAGQAGSNACRDETIVSSVKQEAHIL